MRYGTPATASRFVTKGMAVRLPLVLEGRLFRMPSATFIIDFAEGSARGLMWIDSTVGSGPFRIPVSGGAFAVVRVSFDKAWRLSGGRITV